MKTEIKKIETLKVELNEGDTIEVTNPDLVLDPSKPAYIKRTL